MLTPELTQPNPLDVAFSYHDLNPREDRSDLHTIFVHPGAVFALSGYPEAGKPTDVVGCSYQYSDLLFGAVGTLGLSEARDRVGNDNTPRYFQESLRLRKDDPSILLRHLQVGCNIGDGYPYLRLGFTTPGHESAELVRYQQMVTDKRSQLAARGILQRGLDSLVSMVTGDSRLY